MWNVGILTIQAVILGVQVALGALFFIHRRKQESTYECDRLFMEIEKTLLSDPGLLSEFYCVGPEEERKSWRSLTDEQRRMYVFCEMNYFHFAFVHREFLLGHVAPSYWSIYQDWLKKLLKHSAMFRQVHQYSRGHFEPAFAQLVERLEKEL